LVARIVIGPAPKRGPAWPVVLGALLAVLILVIPIEAYVYGRDFLRAEVLPAGSSALDEFNSHINHIVFVILENHAYDNYFGTYCAVTGPYCSDTGQGLPSNTCVPLFPSMATSRCERPYNYTAANWTIKPDMAHNEVASLAAWNAGAMDGFYGAEGRLLTPFGHYNGTTAPIVWDLAEQYSIDDNFFSSILSYSLPNHWHTIAGQAPSYSVGNFTQGQGAFHPPVSGEHLYLNQSNETKSIEDLLVNTSVSWKYYDFPLANNYSDAIRLGVNSTGVVTSVGSAYDYWNPQAAKAESYDAALSPHFVSNTQFFGDAHNGTLPALSWVIPSGQDSDHPALSNSTVAQGWLASVVDAVEASPDWGSSAVFICWDDYGGFYDHVDPPTVDNGWQLGFRVPYLVVSPYARENYISGQFGYFESVLHLMEDRFGLGCIATLDCNAPLPLDTFDFSQSPRSPMLFPTSVAGASYPMPLQSSGTTTSLRTLEGFAPPQQYVVFPGGEAPDID
jgi:phospholipase C